MNTVPSLFVCVLGRSIPLPDGDHLTAILFHPLEESGGVAGGGVGTVRLTCIQQRLVNAPSVFASASKHLVHSDTHSGPESWAGVSCPPPFTSSLHSFLEQEINDICM